MDILEVKSNKPGMDVIVSGGVLANVQASSVMVEDQYDLPGMYTYAPGTIAFTPGYKAIWQLNNAGTTWVDLLGSSDVEVELPTDDEDPETADDSDPETSD